MCDTIAGELIVVASRDDTAAEAAMSLLNEVLHELADDPLREGRYRVDRLDDMVDRLHLEVYPRSAYWRVVVPAYHEEAIIERLYAWHRFHRAHFGMEESLTPPSAARRLDDYDDRPDSFIVTRNARLSGLGIGVGGAGPSLIQMQPSFHTVFLQMVGCDQPVRGMSTVTVAVLDTGIDDDTRQYLQAPGRSINEVDIVSVDDPGGPSPLAQDGSGHGSVVARIVDDGAPGCHLVIVRVLDDRRTGSEWELVAGLHAAKSFGAQVLNLSLGTGLDDGAVCRRCGRRGQNVRARALQRALLDFHSEAHSAPLVVAATGNRGKVDLSFPARFPEVVAVAAVTSGGVRSTFSNHGTMAWLKDAHKRLFSGPGGQAPVDPATPAEVTEWVAAYAATGDRFHGTSAASAYAAAVAARFVAYQQAKGFPVDPATIANLMAQRAATNSKDQFGYGNGLVLAPAPW
jgi:hypothetical protein